MGWYGSAFFLALSASQSAWGRAYAPRAEAGGHDPRRAYAAALAVFEAGSLLCGAARGSAGLVAGRAVQGAGGAGVSLGAYALAARVARPEGVPAVVGLVGCVFAVGGVVGPLLGGAFTQAGGWRWCFYVNLPVGGAAAALVLLFLRPPGPSAEPGDGRRRRPGLSWAARLLGFDPVGLVLVVAALLCCFLVFQRAGISQSWGDASSIVLLLGWVLLTVAFAINEYWQGERALLVIRILRRRHILAVCCFQFL